MCADVYTHVSLIHGGVLDVQVPVWYVPSTALCNSVGYVDSITNL